MGAANTEEIVPYRDLHLCDHLTNDRHFDGPLLALTYITHLPHMIVSFPLTRPFVYKILLACVQALMSVAGAQLTGALVSDEGEVGDLALPKTR